MRSEVGLNFYQLTFISFLHRVQQGLVVRRIDNAIHWINLYPVESAECIVNTYPPDSDLSGGYRYPTLKQLALVLNLILPLLYCLEASWPSGQGDGCQGDVDDTEIRWSCVQALHPNTHWIYSCFFRVQLLNCAMQNPTSVPPASWNF